MVGEVVLKSNTEQFEGDCPVDFYFTSIISATRPGKVTYRFVDERGLASEALELEFLEPGDQTTRIIRRHLGMLTGQGYTRLLALGMETVNTHLFKGDEEIAAELTADMTLPEGNQSDSELAADQNQAVESTVAENVVLATAVSESSKPDSDTLNPGAAEEATAPLTDLEWDIQGSMTLEILSPEIMRSEPKLFFANCTE